MTADDPDALSTAGVLMMIGFGGNTAGGVFHMLKK